jgi:hypothetical protein
MRWLLALALLFAPAGAHAYGFFTHEAIARMAMLNVRPETARAVRAMLRAAPPLIQTPECKAATPEQASTWPDCVRNLGERFSYTANWHYQNVDVCQPFDLKAACRDGNCVSAQVERQVKLLQNRTVPQREKAMALIFLIHFVGDLHAPPHAGDRGDRGGNDVKASYGPVTARWLNLHSIWDSPLAERAVTTPPSPIRAYSPAERAALAAGTPEDWSREGWEASRDTAYALALGGDPCGPKPEGLVTVTPEAIEKMVPVQRRQIERAGVRLARMLDEAFDPARAFVPEKRAR